MIYFWALFLISVLVSQSAMDFFSVLFCGAWIWSFWKSKKSARTARLLPTFGLETVWIAWVLIVAIGFFLNPLDPSYGVTRVVEFKWILILYAMVGIWLQLKPDRRYLGFFIGYMLFFSVTNLLFFFVNVPLFASLRYGSHEFLRAGGFFGNPMTFAHSFLIFLCLFMGVVLSELKSMTQKQKLWALVALGCSVLGLLLTFTRGVWIGFTVSILVTFLFWKPKYSLVLGILVVGLAFGTYQSSQVFRWRVDSTIREVQGHSERKNLWQANALMVKENPFFGLGYGQNTMELPKFYDRLGITEGRMESHAHNQLIHLAAGTGLLGLFCYVAVWLFFYILLIRLWRMTNLESWDRGIVLGALLGQTAFLIGGLTEANFEHSKVRFAVMIAWSYVIYLGFKYQKLPNWNWKK